MWSDLATLVLLATFAVAAAAVFAAGVRMTRTADRLADRTGMGEAMVGGVLLGAATSIGGVIVSITSAYDGHAALAFSNSVGGIAAQTVFLAVADIAYRRVNLEHAAADLGNIFQGIVLLVLLTLPFLASTTPEISIFAIHPVSLLIPVVYGIGLVAQRSVHEEPMWTPVETSDTDVDTPEAEDAASRRKSTLRFFIEFLILMLLMGAAGWAIAKSAAVLSERLSLSEGLVGALATAVVTSLPELVTTVAAVRRGSLQLAVGGIIGGNTFDTLFLTAADISYRDGSLYHAVPQEDYFWVVSAILMTGVLLGGLILRQRQGPARIGAESLALVLVYAAAVVVQILPT